MREVNRLIQAITYVIFKKEIITYEVENPLKYTEGDLLHRRLLELLNEMRINEAEDLLFESLCYGDKQLLAVALDFYSRLNSMTDEMLVSNGFSREEIHLGLKEIQLVTMGFEL